MFSHLRAGKHGTRGHRTLPAYLHCFPLRDTAMYRSTCAGYSTRAVTTGRSQPAAQRWEILVATGETGFDDVTFDLVSVQYHSLKAGHDYGQYVRDADNAGRQDIADFFRKVMEDDSARAKQCHEFLKELSGSSESGPAVS
ncbi:hypothetical protein [Amycolatopsis mediterranei]|uniref:hypothetical protein n=1 Tax=Amycolatopsis mediterranei TaxID=33910 RepID=UPI001F43B6DE|nr:hypothetical protein [Amycolatopsis mediterranei]